MFSIKNSYDYKRYYNNNLTVLPFTGIYEPTIEYKTIYIYGKTIKNDTLYVDYTNDIYDENAEITEIYNYNNTEIDLKLSTKLKYFRLRITTEDDFSTSHQRIYNVYYSVQQLLTTSSGGSLNLSKDTSSISIYDSNGVGLTTDASGNLKVAADLTIPSVILDKTTSSISIYDSNGVGLTTDASGNLKVAADISIPSVILDKTTSSISIYDSNGVGLTTDASGNLKTALYSSNGVGLITNASGVLLIKNSNTPIGSRGNIANNITFTYNTDTSPLNINNNYGSESILSYEDSSPSATSMITIWASNNGTTYNYIGVIHPIAINSSKRYATTILKLGAFTHIKLHNEGTVTADTASSCYISLFSS